MRLRRSGRRTEAVACGPSNLALAGWGRGPEFLKGARQRAGKARTAGAHKWAPPVFTRVAAQCPAIGRCAT